jgi:hypothetical protein
MTLTWYRLTEARMVCDYKWHSVVRVLFFILDEVFSVNTTCFVKTVIYPTSFVSTGQPYKNTQNCAKSSKNHPSWLLGNPKV